MNWDTLWINARLATMTAGSAPYGLMEDAALAVQGGVIAWIGPMSELPADDRVNCPDVLDCGGRLVSPGLIDCHTHLVYAGDRAQEFELRLNGASYEEIAAAGGGIKSTVNATRAADEETLLEQSLPRLRRLMADGVTTVEIKSGYGLNTEAECRMLRVARRLGEVTPVTVRTSFLGAHALPPEYMGRPDAYIDQVCTDMLPAAAEADLADAVDAFCEGIGFTPAQVERVFQAARARGLPVKLHAEQLSNLRGAVLAAGFDALSVDHLEFLDPADVPLLAAHDTVAVLLPGAFYCLRETQLPPIDALRQHGVPMAIASDSNPGSSPVTALLLMLNMGCTLFGLTPEEALAGVTRNAATALGIADEVGTLAPGKRADLVLWRATSPAELAYRIGDLMCDKVLYAGRQVPAP